MSNIQERRIKASGIPAVLHPLRLDQLRALDTQSELYQALQFFAAGEVPGLFLHGDVGRGKTYMAAAAAMQLMALRPVKFTSAPQLMSGLAANFDDDRYTQAISILHGKVALVLDDLGQERTTEATREALHAAVDSRYLARVPLLITSNFTPSELGARYGAWLASRLADMRCLRAVGPDIRLQES